LFLLLPIFALLFPLPAKSANCDLNPMARIFERYQSITDEQIGKDCTYDLLRFEPDASTTDFKVNERRTSNCEKGLRRMREISQRYIAKKSQVCNGIQIAPACADKGDQSTCLVDAGNMSAGAQQGEEELGGILQSGQVEIADIARFHRLQTEKFMRDLKALQKMPPRQKTTDKDPRSTATTAKDKGPRDVTPTVSGRKPVEASKSYLDPAASPEAPPKSVVSRGGKYQPPVEMRPRDAGVRTLGEYEQRLPYLIREHEASLKRLNEFEEASSANSSEHKAAASTFAVNAAKFFLAAEKMGYAEEGVQQWEKQNPEAVAEAKAQMAGAVPAPTSLVVGEEKEPGEEEASQKESRKNRWALQTAVAERKQDLSERLPGSAGADTPKEDAMEEPALESFTAKLSDESKSPRVIAERTRLRELLRRKLRQEEKGGIEKVPGEIVGEILAEAKSAIHREPAAEERRKEGVGTLDVESALEDIEGQLRELDRQAGILESETSSLFERVRWRLERKQKEWRE
jgi:hypothetical protein